MKKRIYLFITIILSLFVFSDRVEAATVMYYECDYDSYEEVDFNMVIRATHSFGVDYMFTGYGSFFHGQADQYIEGLHRTHQVVDYCWIKNSSDINDVCSIGGNASAVEFKMNNKICPASIRYTDTIALSDIIGIGKKVRFKDGYLSNLVFAGQKEPSSPVSIIEDDEYIVYKIYSEVDQRDVFVFEAYSADSGQYLYINRNFDKSFPTFLGIEISPDEIDYYQAWSAYENGSRFWKVATNFGALYPSLSGYCSSYDDCVTNKNYVEVLSSSDSDTTIYDYVNEWYSLEGNKYGSINELAALISDDKFMSACNNLISSYESGVNYRFTDGYNFSECV